jgi:uncharacterized HAD superfamily protein
MTPIICFDIDGVIASGTLSEIYSDEAGWAYEKCTPIKSTISIIWELRQRGACIILHTARLRADRDKTEKWLFDNGVSYDELVMGKPYAHMYIDDKNFPVPFDPSSAGIRSKLIEFMDDFLPRNTKS